MIYGFSTIRVKNKSAIVIYLLSHQDFSAIILAVNENYSSIQLSDKVVNTRTTNYFSLSNSSVRVHKWTKLIMFPRSFFTLHKCKFSHNKLLLLSWNWQGKKKPANLIAEIASGTGLPCNGVNNSWIFIFRLFGWKRLIYLETMQ